GNHSAVIVQLRSQLALGPVLAAEEALQRYPADPRARVRLAEACSSAGDPVGTALALYPLVAAPNVATPRRSSDLTFQYFNACLRIGWPDEAAPVLRGLTAPPPRARLDLAAAYAGHGQSDGAGALLERLGQEPLAPDEWLDGAITAYHCRRPEQAIEWAR